MAEQQLLDVPLPTIDDSLTDTRLALTAEYSVIGESALDATSALYPMGTSIGRFIFALYLKAREFASQGTEFGATGQNLDSFLEVNGVTVPTAATAVHTVAITGVNSFALPAGSEIASDGGQLYTTDGPLAFPAPETTLNVQMTAADIGSVYNLEIGTTAPLKVLDDDLQPKVTIVSLDTAGSDPADETAKASLLRAAKAQSNAAGTAANYRFLLRQLDGSIGVVFSAESYPFNGAISLFPLLALTPQEIQDTPWLIKLPSAGQLSTWEAALQSDDVRRVNDRVFVTGLVERLVPLTITAIPNTVEVQTSIKNSLQNGFAQFYAPTGYTIPNSEISGFISAAAGETSHTLNDVDGLGPDADAVAATEILLQVGVITWL